MFGDTLLESSPASRKRKRWPMATAFTAQTVIAAIIVAVPLLTTGVIPLVARVPVYAPEKPIHLEPERVVVDRTPHTGPATPAARPAVVLVSDNKDAILWKSNLRTTTDIREVTPPGYTGPSDAIPKDLAGGPSTDGARPGPGPGRKIVISVLEEARLVNKVEPVYPRIAVISGV